jgi:hypothetical protein
MNQAKNLTKVQFRLRASGIGHRHCLRAVPSLAKTRFIELPACIMMLRTLFQTGATLPTTQVDAGCCTGENLCYPLKEGSFFADTPRLGGTKHEHEWTYPLAAPYPGVPTAADGSGTVSWVETHITQGACAYPITSSTVMGANYAQALHQRPRPRRYDAGR